MLARLGAAALRPYGRGVLGKKSGILLQEYQTNVILFGGHMSLKVVHWNSYNEGWNSENGN